MPGRAFALLISIVVMASCTECENRIVRRIPSPDRERQAVVFRRECGARSGVTTHVSVIPPYSVSQDPGNVLILDSSNEELQVGGRKGPAVDARWTGPRDLELRYSSAARAFKIDSVVDGVHVMFVR